jgi:adenosylhomocysteine nucleosidase
MIEPGTSVTFIAATGLEYGALRRALPSTRVVRTGIALADVRCDLGEVVVSCGVAGGLRPDLPTGTLLIPRSVRRPDGSILTCDPQLVEIFALSARRIGIEPVFDPMLTADVIVRGAARAQWAAQGYAGVDMETGRIVAPRVAAVRVVLDTPAREISSDWQAPVRAIIKPWNWPQALWLAREAPRGAALAARVAAAAQGIAGQVRI